LRLSATIELSDPRLIDDSTVQVEFEVSRELSRYFRAGELTVSYDLSVRDVSPGILVIPLLANIAPLAWVFDAEIRTTVCDETYLRSLERVRVALQALYPGLPLAGAITASEAVAAQISAPNGAGLLFSGGVDSTASAVAHRDEDLHLFTVILSERHNELSHNVHVLADALGASHHTIRAPILEELLDRQHLSQLFKKQFLDWWSGIQYGLGLTGLCAPPSKALDLGRIYLAGDSVLNKDHGWGSDPTTDNEIAWSGTHVSHDLQEESRLEKIERIIDFQQAGGAGPASGGV
jgi:asparagine synthase